MIPPISELVRSNADLARSLVELTVAAQALVERYYQDPLPSAEDLDGLVAELARTAYPGLLGPLPKGMEDLVRQRAALRSLVRRAYLGDMGADWTLDAEKVLGLTGRGPGGGA